MRPSRRAGSIRLLGLLLALFATACASTSEGSDPFGRSSGQEEAVLLTVENHDFRDATIYAYWNGMRDRVGLVTGKTKKTFEMRWRSEDLQLEIDFVGGGGHRSEVIPVWEGDHLHYVIQIRG